MERLPEGCISHIISFTSPADACRLAAVSPTFRSAADSDGVWERFLPYDVRDIVSRADNPVEYASAKELFFLLCDSVLIDGGRKSFSLERSSGKKCFLLSARELWITWGESPQYWQWIPNGDGVRSRFPETAILNLVWWFQIGGRVDCRILSEATQYSAHLVFRMTANSRGFDVPQKTSIKIGAVTSEATVYLEPERFPSERDEKSEDQVPRERGDGWREIEIGRFFCGDGYEGEVEFSLWETDDYNPKSGILVEGIQVRPAT